MKVSLDIHDPSILNSGLDWWLKIKDHYPDFKVSLFWIPFDPFTETSSMRINRDKEVKRLKENLDWIQIIPHGLTHMTNEFKNCDYYTMRDLVLPSIDEAFKKDDLPYEKGFCAPFWLWNEDVTRALDARGWWGAVDKNQPDMIKTQKTYTYTHSIDEPFWESKDEVLNLHGHLDGTSDNDIERCFLNILKLPVDAEWHFVTDFVK